MEGISAVPGPGPGPSSQIHKVQQQYDKPNCSGVGNGGVTNYYKTNGIEKYSTTMENGDVCEGMSFGYPSEIGQIEDKTNGNNSSSRSCCYKICSKFSNLGKGSTWLGILLGQLCSGLLVLTAITSVVLSNVHSVNLPNAQNFAFYLVLSMIFTSTLACRTGDRNLFPVLKLRGWKYVLVAFADVEANFLIVKAYQYTTLTSVQLLDCFAIPTVLSLSWLILRIRYKVPHILGTFVCLLGVCCLVWADVDSNGRHSVSGKDRFLGDMMSLGGAFLFGVSSVAEEFVIRTFDWIEFLGMIGVFGSFICGIQAILLEYSTIVNSNWNAQTILLIGTYAFAQVVLYSLAALVIKLSSATSFNLSILSADFYTLLIGVQLFQYKFHLLYLLSFSFVLLGLIIYSLQQTTTAAKLYSSLVREPTTITTDLELIASGKNNIQSHQWSNYRNGHIKDYHPHSRERDNNIDVQTHTQCKESVIETFADVYHQNGNHVHYNNTTADPTTSEVGIRVEPTMNFVTKLGNGNLKSSRIQNSTFHPHNK